MTGVIHLALHSSNKSLLAVIGTKYRFFKGVFEVFRLPQLAILLAMSLPIMGLADQGETVTPSVKDQPTEDPTASDHLLLAIQQGDLAGVKRSRHAFERFTHKHYNAIFERPKLEIVEFLHNQRIVNIHELQLAAIRGNAREMKSLLKKLRPRQRPLVQGHLFQMNLPVLEVGYCSFLSETSATPLRLAVRSGHVDMVRVLIEAGANVNDRLVRFQPNYDPVGDTLLTEAVSLGNAKIVKLLVRHGAYLEEWSEMYFSRNDGPKVDEVVFMRHSKLAPPPTCSLKEELDSLVEAGKLGKQLDLTVNASSPLMLAIDAGRPDLVKILLDAGANASLFLPGRKHFSGIMTDEFNSADRYPIHHACRKGVKKTVQLLIKHGADVNAKTSEGVTPLALTTQHDHKDLANYLRANGAK